MVTRSQSQQPNVEHENNEPRIDQPIKKRRGRRSRSRRSKKAKSSLQGTPKPAVDTEDKERQPIGKNKEQALSSNPSSGVVSVIVDKIHEPLQAALLLTIVAPLTGNPQEVARVP